MWPWTCPAPVTSTISGWIGGSSRCTGSCPLPSRMPRNDSDSQTGRHVGTRPRRGAGQPDLVGKAQDHRDGRGLAPGPPGDRKSTRLNSSHVEISYAVFCLKKKKKK